MVIIPDARWARVVVNQPAGNSEIKIVPTLQPRKSVIVTKTCIYQEDE